jgi:hypothetical protein
MIQSSLVFLLERIQPNAVDRVGGAPPGLEKTIELKSKETKKK